MKFPNLLFRKVLTASCVETLEFFDPPVSLSPSPGSIENSLITVPPERLKLRLSRVPIETLLLKTMLPVLLYAVIKLPTEKSPSSFVPEENTLPPPSCTC